MKTLLVALNSSYTHSSLAIPYLQAACRAWLPGFPLPLKKEYYLRQDSRRIARELADESPELIGFSCYVFNISRVLEVARMVRDLLPDVLILFGGPETANGGVDLMAARGGPDFVIRGEGEAAFVELVRRLADGTGGYPGDLPGLTWKRGGTIVLNAPGAPCDSLDDLPSPFKAGLNACDKPFALFESSRGCPFLCDFCLSAGGRLREFSTDRVFDDIDIIARQGIKEIRFVDRTFNARAERAIAILKYIERHHPGMRVHIELEPSLPASREFLDCLDRDNMHAEIGLQDLNPDVLRNVNRKPIEQDALEAVRGLCRDSRCRIHLDLIAGLPGATLQGLYRDVSVLTEFAPQELQLETLKVLKATRLRFSPDLFYDRHPPYIVTRTRTMTGSDMKEAHLLSRLIDMFYNDRHLGPVVRCAHGVLCRPDGFWPAFCEWWRNGGFGSFGVDKIKRFARLLLFLRERAPSDECRFKLFGQWVFRRLSYAKFKPRLELEGTECVGGGKVSALPSAITRCLNKTYPDAPAPVAGSWSIWHFEHDPMCVEGVPADYLWLWDNPKKTSESRYYRIAGEQLHGKNI